ncbi:hypothetical protein OMP38_28810 [Cohnella ginsengisoli]|uniref:histidine kinase n=1 Tax=Cohnella ginsengisoli TaxID=425004 RepID=A0A9X4QPY6_9BACL|nr:histidine kinase dimerization/phospho-acceptor domain-containing protein [Cohnella ginsengisoli]MDG0794388.1 hypothetical protein [Cohnella ginsengisoli]
MIGFLAAFAALLGIAAIALAALLRKRSRQLDYLHVKLNAILENGTNERLLMFDSGNRVGRLLSDLNRLLDHAHRAGARYTNQEIEIRRMLSNISHDLKTPLTVVLGYSEILLHDRSLAEREREAMTANIHEKAQEVLRLVHSFFDLAKLEAGDTEIVLTRVNASELCRLKLLSFLRHVCKPWDKAGVVYAGRRPVCHG